MDKNYDYLLNDSSFNQYLNQHKVFLGKELKDKYPNLSSNYHWYQLSNLINYQNSLSEDDYFDPVSKKIYYQDEYYTLPYSIQNRIITIDQVNQELKEHNIPTEYNTLGIINDLYNVDLTKYYRINQYNNGLEYLGTKRNVLNLYLDDFKKSTFFKTQEKNKNFSL